MENAGMAAHWTLDPAITFLNHGSFGATPQVVQDTHRAIQEELERNPVNFFQRQLTPRLDQARHALADFVQAESEDLVFVKNTTEGINTVLKSLKFRPSDELLVTNHEYNACRIALDTVARRDSAKVVVVDLPFPVASRQALMEAVLEKVTPFTRLALIDHVTSPTGLILPVEEIVTELNARGVDTLIDGAHALGMLPLNLKSLGATYYTGNCHKWFCAPKTSAFLCVDASRRKQIRPLSTSHGANAAVSQRSRYQLEFDWTGTHDPSSALCIPACIDFFRTLMPGGWEALRTRNHRLALQGRQLLCEAVNVHLPAPDACIGSMATVPLPDGVSEPRSDTVHGQHPLQVQLWEQYRIEVPIVSWPHSPKRWVRLSTHAYNSLADVETLAGALGELL